MLFRTGGCPRWNISAFGGCASGGIDEQEILPHGTSADVRRETLRVMEILGDDGAYIVGPAHALQLDTSPENIMALYDTARQYRLK